MCGLTAQQLMQHLMVSVLHQSPMGRGRGAAGNLPRRFGGRRLREHRLPIQQEGAAGTRRLRKLALHSTLIEAELATVWLTCLTYSFSGHPPTQSLDLPVLSVLNKLHHL
jgi:hypothetical protein